MVKDNLIQIAGVIDAAEAQMLQQCGVRYLGFPLRLPVHREGLTETEAAMLIKGLAPAVFGVLITYLDEANEIAAFCHALSARIVQLHGDIDRDELKPLKTLDPTLTVIKSLIVGMHDDKTLETMLSELSRFVDAFIPAERSLVCRSNMKQTPQLTLYEEKACAPLTKCERRAFEAEI
jgi:phosphoribosylanthranilate isomerase